MWIFFGFVFLKGPLWLRIIAWGFVAMILYLALVLTFTRPGGTERLHLDHVNSTHHPATQPQRR